jgi:hypothetical protein
MSSKYSLYQGVIEGNGIQDQEAIAAGEMTDIARRKDRQVKAGEWQGNKIHLQEAIGKGRRASVKSSVRDQYTDSASSYL